MQQGFLFLFIFFFHFFAAAQYQFSGLVVNAQNDPLVGASVINTASQLGTVTDLDGRFQLEVSSASIEIAVSYIGYQTLTKPIDNQGVNANDLRFVLNSSAVTLEGLEVRALRSTQETPFVFQNITGDDIRLRAQGQDAPFALQFTPSAVVTSDAGTGVGYTGIRIRGTDPTRINVTINGVPVNDAESQGVFWVNMPDLLASAEDVQIQRGVGTSTNGAGAFGATLNVRTTRFLKEPFAEATVGYGAFNTRRASVQGGAPITDKISVEGRLSSIQSDGYIDRGSADLQSGYLAASYKGKKSLVHLVGFHGHEVTYQAWNGVPITYLGDPELRRFNTAGTEKPGTPYENEVDDYQQTYLQLITNHTLTENIQLNATGFYTRGIGFFEQYKANQNQADYALQLAAAPDETPDLARRLWLDNHLLGGILNLTISDRAQRINQTFGGSASHYIGDHYGTVAQVFTESEVIKLDDRYYFNDAHKTDINGYSKSQVNLLANRLHLMADLQLRHVNYTFEGLSRNAETVDQTVNYLFFNPKGGVVYDLNARSSVFGSVAVANREPNRNDFVDSTPDSRPRSEQLVDFEAGYRFAGERFTAEAIAYFMEYNDQLVLTGELNDVGASTRTNVADSYRRGIELNAAALLGQSFTLSGNASVSRNKALNHTVFFDNWATGAQEAVSYEESDLAFSPELVAALELQYEKQTSLGTFQPFIRAKHVGEQYLDNTSRESALMPDYQMIDFGVRWSKALENDWEISLRAEVQNLFDAQFWSNGWIYSFASPGYDPRPDDPYAIAAEGTERYNLVGTYPQAGRMGFLTLALRWK